MEFSIGDSPLPEVTFRRYVADSFPKFRVVFEPNRESGPLRFLARAAEDAEFAVVMENHSRKDLTALRYLWIMTHEDGQLRKRTCSSDSYMVDVYRPVLKADDRALITRSGIIHESTIDHVANGGGTIGSRVGVTGRKDTPAVKSLRFEVDMLLFADGELAGPDANKFAFELHSRKPAAEFVARQIRAAEAENRDVTPVLKALAAMPHLRDDHLAASTREYASQYLRNMQPEKIRIGTLRHLENRPTLPKFYRRDR